MAGIASSRIASGAGVFHKPQAKDAGLANAADGASPFQQLLDTGSPIQVADGQDVQDQSDCGKDSKDSNAADKPDQTRQSLKAQLIAATEGKSVVKAVNDDGSAGDAGQSQTGGKAGNASGTTRNKASSDEQTTLDTSQALVTAQISATSQDGMTEKKPDAKDGGGATAATLKTKARQNADLATAQAASADSESAEAATTDTSSKIKAGKNVDTFPAKAQTTQSGAAQSSGAEKKGRKSDKTQDAAQDAGNSAVDQTVPSSVQAVAVASVTLQPPQTSNIADPDQSDAILAAATDATKGTAKGSQPNSAPITNAPAQKGNAANAASHPNSANGAQASDNQASDNTVPAETDTTQNTDAAQSSQAADPVADKGDKQSSAAQPQAQAAPQAQPQPAQPQTAIPAVQPPIPPQAHAGAAGSVAQNVQVGPQDSSATANTMGALAVAIAAKSQSGNKQFDIRLDPPELGRVEVRLSIDSTGKAQASLSADQPHTLDLLKTDAPVLTRALRDAGLNVAQNGLSFSLRGQSQQNGGNGGGFTPRSSRGSQTSLIATSAIGTVQSGANYYGPADGRLDIRV